MNQEVMRFNKLKQKLTDFVRNNNAVYKWKTLILHILKIER